MSDCPEWGSSPAYEVPLAGGAFLVARINELLLRGEATWSLTRMFQDQIVVVAAGICSSLAEARSQAAAAPQVLADGVGAGSSRVLEICRQAGARLAKSSGSSFC